MLYEEGGPGFEPGVTIRSIPVGNSRFVRCAHDALLGGIPFIGNRLFYDHLALAVGAEDDGTIVLVNAGFRREREDIRAFAFIGA